MELMARVSHCWSRCGKSRCIRELSALFNLALKMSFLVEKVLETEICLVHIVSCISSLLFVVAGGCVGGTVECLEASEERASTDMDDLRVLINMRLGHNVLEAVDYGVGGE